MARIKKDIVIIYHAECSDGFGGAWAAWKKFGGRAEYIAMHYHSKLPEGLKNKEIYMIDFTFPRQVIKKLLKENKRVTSIDHHLTRKEETMMTYEYSYALNNSGSVLAWKYFHPGKPVPKMLRHIEDMDIWKFKLSHTWNIFLYLDLFDRDFKVWDKLAEELDNPRIYKKRVAEGGLLVRFQEKLIERTVDNNAELVEFEGYKTYAVNSCHFTSQIGSALYKKFPPIAIIWSQRAGKKIISLRSDGTVDVAKLAEKYGGGGHKAASGFNLPGDAPLPWKTLKEDRG